jgi:hypothetical protein
VHSYIGVVKKRKKRGDSQIETFLMRFELTNIEYFLNIFPKDSFFTHLFFSKNSKFYTKMTFFQNGTIIKKSYKKRNKENYFGNKVKMRAKNP